jgi:tetratricopeptide (TPR) repeat protein
MKLWDEQGSSWNFRHKLQLMQAEEYFSTGDFQQARESYKNAIHTAGSHKFVNDEALSCELAGRFYFETDNRASSLEHFNLARKRYIDWGCVAKANRLLSFLASNSINNQQETL